MRRVEGFIGSCWDAGLEIGSSVHHLRMPGRKRGRCDGSNLAARSSPHLRECGAVCTLPGPVPGANGSQGLPGRQDAGDAPAPHQYDNTPYALEPNCKESPGGLRDLQLIPVGCQGCRIGRQLERTGRQWHGHPFEVRQIERNEALLCLIRARLHQAAGRHEDHLVFDLQTTVAESFGYRSQAPDGSRLPMRASETLMRRYYWAARRCPSSARSCCSTLKSG